MLKLAFPVLMTVPVFALALGARGGVDIPDYSAQSRNTAVPATAVLASAPIGVEAECRSETLGVTFSHGLLESHSAERLGEAFATDDGCETAFVRLTSLVDEADHAETVGITKERRELAMHIAALVGDEAETLRVFADVQSARAGHPGRAHALVRIERRPVSGGRVKVAEATSGGALSDLLD